MIGTRVLHYEIVEHLGAGGMGEVFLAQDSRLNRSVAVKFLPEQLANDSEFKERFLHEAEAAAALNHPNIITVHDVGEFQGRPFIVMERLEGITLQERIASGEVEIDEALEIVRQILEGLAAAHKAGIVHRDIKPANLFITDHGITKILDFGLAKSQRATTETKVGSTLGTVQYESPEQSIGEPVDRRSDLFSLGVVLYELVTGRLPFAGDFEAAIRYAIAHDTPEPLARYKSGVSDELERFVAKLLEKDVALRYQDAPGAISDLRGLSRPSAHPPQAAPAPTPKKPLIITAVSVLVAAVLVMAAVLMFRGDDPVPGHAGPMLAVLPFENLGPAEDDYFADGMTEEITSRLAQIPALGVISRTSAVRASVAGLSLKDIGKQLGVQYVLEGTIRWSRVANQTRVRITPQLIRVADDRHVWANNYERALLEVFAVQSDIADKIVSALGITLVDSGGVAPEVKPTDHEGAYKLYLKAINLVRQTEREDKWDYRAERWLDSAVVLDPQFALAHALRAEAYAHKAFAAPHSEDAKISLSAARRALELQPDLPQARLALGWYYNKAETDYVRALDEFLTARKSIPNDADLNTAIAWVRLRNGDFEKALDDYLRAAELDPLNPDRHAELAECYKVMRRYDEALAAIDRAIEQRPDYWLYHTRKIFITVQKSGNLEDLKQVIYRGMEACGTLDIVWQTWKFSAYLPELNWDSLSRVYSDIMYGRDIGKDELYERHSYQYAGLGDSLRLRAYADSLRPYLEKRYEDDPESALTNSALGLLLARIGECDRAIEFGERGKELLSIDECHH